MTDAEYRTEAYDEVVFACHPDQALALLEEGSEAQVGRCGVAVEEDWVVIRTVKKQRGSCPVLS